jgi:hypothetical protein
MHLLGPHRAATLHPTMDERSCCHQLQLPRLHTPLYLLYSLLPLTLLVSAYERTWACCSEEDQHEDSILSSAPPSGPTPAVLAWALCITKSATSGAQRGASRWWRHCRRADGRAEGRRREPVESVV